MTAIAPTPSASALSWRSTAIAAAVGAAGALVINSALAWAGRSLFDVPATFQPLTLPAFGTLTVVGVLIGAIGWHLVAARRRGASRLLSRLVPTVLLLSLIPDALLLIDTSAQPGITTGGVVTLMLMHLGVAVAAVPSYRRFIPPQS